MHIVQNTVALIEEEPKISVRKLISVGIPSFIVAVMISMITHQYAHTLVASTICGTEQMKIGHAMNVIDLHTVQTPCAVSSLAGPVWTFVLALVSFGLLLKYPRNLFVASMAFVNVTLRLPETIAVFLQLLIDRKVSLVVDESSLPTLLHFKEPTIATVIMCFYSIILIFFTMIVVHDMKAIPKKWYIALGLFLLLGSVESILWRALTPLFA